MTTGPYPGKPRSRWWVGCLGCLGMLIMCCVLVAAASWLLPKMRPSARDIYSGAPDLAAGSDVT
ncbi:hypothetical protein ACFLXB_09660, partial [Chloroflexota bacterium]